MSRKLLAKSRSVLRSASSAVDLLESRLFLSAVTANFEGGNGTTSVDQYVGVSGNGWLSAWTPASGTGSLLSSATMSVSVGSGSVVDSGKRLSAAVAVSSSASSGGAGGIGRAYTSYGSGAGLVSTTSTHQLSFYYGLDTGASLNTAGDAVVITGDNATKLATASSNTWLAAAYGGAVGSSAAMTWAFQDGAQNSGHSGSNVLVNTGVSLVAGHIYQFTITLDPGLKRYKGTVRDLNTNDQFTSGLCYFRSASTSTSAINFNAIFDQASDSGSFSIDSIDAAPPIGAPTGFSATSTASTSAALNWTDASSNETGFDLLRSTDQVNWTLVTSPAAGAQSYTDTGLTAGTTYYYLLHAKNADANSADAQTSVVTLPANVTTVNSPTVTPSSVSLTWTAVTKATSYRVERQTSTGAFTLVGSPTGASYIDSTVDENVQYGYRIRARNSAGALSAAWSPTVTATTPLLPAGYVTAVPLSSSQIQITWVDVSNSESNYKVERSSNNSTWTTVATLAVDSSNYTDSSLSESATFWYRVTPTTSTSSTPGTSVSATTLPATPTGLTGSIEAGQTFHLIWHDSSGGEQGYRVERRPTGGTWINLSGALAPDMQSFSDTTAAANASYDYRVFAFNGAGDSAASNIFTANTNIPAPASSLVAVNNGSSGIALNWTYNSANETGFELQRRTGTDAFVTIATLPVNTQGATDTGTLLPGVLYDYRVIADGAWNNASASNVASIVTALAAPANVAVTALTLSDASISWTASAAATGYEVFRSQANLETSTPALGAVWSSLGTTTGTSLTDTTVAPGYSYLYRVQAKNSISQSANSASTLLPGQPTNLAATTLSDTAIQITWTDVLGEDHYRLERAIGSGDYAPLTNGNLSGGVLPANTTSYTDSGLTPATLYRYRIRAVSVSDVVSTAAGGVSTTTLPATPTNLLTTEINAGHVELSWTGSAGATQYEIERQLNSGAWTTLGTTPATTYSTVRFIKAGPTHTASTRSPPAVILLIRHLAVRRSKRLRIRSMRTLAAAARRFSGISGTSKPPRTPRSVRAKPSSLRAISIPAS